MGLLLAILVVLPILEVASIVWVAHQVGVLWMLVLLIGISACGAILAKRVGLEVWRRFRATLAAGDIPSGEVFDGALILLAAACFLVPGFITDMIGLLLLLPPVRSTVKLVLWRRMRRRMIAATERFDRRRSAPIRVQSVRSVAEAPAPKPSVPTDLGGRESGPGPRPW